MKKVTKTEMKTSLKSLKALQAKVDALHLELKQAEEAYESLRLETMRKVEVFRLARSTQLVFNGRILNVKQDGGFWFDIKENGVETHKGFRANNIHDLRLKIATGQL